MGNTISYKKIETNNLKGFDLDIPEKHFIAVSGPSGSGKTSLAYGTVYAISQQEWARLDNHPIGAYQHYKVESYHNIKPAIALKQDNRNVNPRSILATFLHLDKYFRLLYAIVFGVSPSRFSLNSPSNFCPSCTGLGYENVVDNSDLVDRDKSILAKPFILLKKPVEQSLLEKYASVNGIPLDVPFRSLRKEHQSLLLYGKSSEKYPIRYKHNGKYRTHSFYYVGYFDMVSSLQSDTTHISSSKKLEAVFKQEVCRTCDGKKFSEDVQLYKYRGCSIGELYDVEISELSQFIAQSLLEETKTEVIKLLETISLVLNKICTSNLGYLSLNRSVPSLSGGEIQRLQLLNIVTSNLNDLIYIVDEPSASLHVSEYESILSDLIELRDRGNTLLMIEHNPYFLSQADTQIYIGPHSGKNGGFLIETPPNAHKLEKLETIYSSKYLSYKNISDNNLKNISVDIPVGSITGIYGLSGSGKTTLSRYIENNTPKAVYLTQKVLRGSKASSIGTYSEILPDIKSLYTSSNGIDYSLSLTDPACQCSKCSGRGLIKYSLDFSATIIEVVCEDCQGMRYNSDVLSLEYNQHKFSRILVEPIERLLEIGVFEGNDKIIQKLKQLVLLGLGHLSLERTTDTLSGGESQRLKVIKVLSKKLKDRIFILDEPLKGLGADDAMRLLRLFKGMAKDGATIIMVEHSTTGFLATDYIIELGPGKGKYGGELLFQGTIEDFQNTPNWERYKDYLRQYIE